MADEKHPVAQLQKADGPYPASCLVTTDPKMPPDPAFAGKGPVYVDGRRFAAWEAAGLLIPRPDPPTAPEGAAGGAGEGKKGALGVPREVPHV